MVQDSQWVTAAISAGAVLISSAAAAWITHYFTGRTEQRRQQHADIQEAVKREHEAKLTHEQRVREQVIATSKTFSKMLQDFRAKIGEATEAADTLAATLLYDEWSAIVRRHHVRRLARHRGHAGPGAPGEGQCGLRGLRVVGGRYGRSAVESHDAPRCQWARRDSRAVLRAGAMGDQGGVRLTCGPHAASHGTSA
ncbi:hypothetical protein Slala02_27390 [Streptomyces lavendulae subsp. lavendulae]|nr:hypothetical protein Slala01_40260 [Streptomyces lavendulae subsp. lavendulae]GLX26919.1 hypothetical protein Slala02_27390 [Streptomyces lavendulae subsp. lavendulae]